MAISSADAESAFWMISRVIGSTSVISALQYQVMVLVHAHPDSGRHHGGRVVLVHEQRAGDVAAQGAPRDEGRVDRPPACPEVGPAGRAPCAECRDRLRAAGVGAARPTAAPP